MFAGAPGILIKIAEMAPPATVAVYTAPNRIKPVAESIWKVKGTSRATAIVGLRPGVAPRKSPPMVPRISTSKFIGVSACGRYCKNSAIVLPFGLKGDLPQVVIPLIHSRSKSVRSASAFIAAQIRQLQTLNLSRRAFWQILHKDDRLRRLELTEVGVTMTE